MAIRRRLETDPELDITSFMSLMTVLVPVLLLNMVFSHISVLNLNLPGLSDPSTTQEQKENQQLELVLRADYIDINYPAGIRAIDTRISELRRALADDPANPSFIETIPSHGYRFIAPVEVTA